MIEPVSTSIAVFALGTSLATLWLTFFRRGTVRMTPPTTIYFGADGGPVDEEPPVKVYLRSLLFATAKRGRVVEGMYAELVRNQNRHIFPVWVVGDQKLVRGSGLFVSETGVAASHHFLTLKDGGNFQFADGEYELSVYAKLLRVNAPILLLSQKLELTAEQSSKMKQPGVGVYFDWIPMKNCYHSHVEIRRPGLDEDFIGLVRSMRSSLERKTSQTE